MRRSSFRRTGVSPGVSPVWRGRPTHFRKKAVAARSRLSRFPTGWKPVLQGAKLLGLLEGQCFEEDGTADETVIELMDRCGCRQLSQTQSDGGLGFFETVATVFFGKSRWQDGGEAPDFLRSPGSGPGQITDLAERLIEPGLGHEVLQPEPFRDRVGDEGADGSRPGDVFGAQKAMIAEGIDQ